MKYIIAAEVAAQKVAESDCELGFKTKPKQKKKPHKSVWASFRILFDRDGGYELINTFKLDKIPFLK